VPRPGHFTPGKDPVPILQKVGTKQDGNLFLAALFFRYVCAGYAASCLLKFTVIFLTSEEGTDAPKRLQPTMKLCCVTTTAKAGYLPPSLVVFQYSTVQNKEPQPSTDKSWCNNFHKSTG
jgi:hypothetical protein